jgi:SsrA-binding protein
MKDKIKIVNRKAKFEYEFLDKYEAGIVLTGVEVKFIRKGHLSFADSFCLFQDNELYLKNVSISGIGNDNIKRDRKLLLHRKELNKLQKQLIDGLTIVPYQIYENDRGIFKVEIVLAKGKKLYDKRETIKERDLKRGMNSDSTSGWYGC